MPEPITEAATPSAVRPGKGRTAGVMGMITVLVAVIGYLREAVLAARFGISATMDAYFAAIFIPNTLYVILIVGTLAPVFIPILMHENPEENPERASIAFSVITNFALLVLLAIVGLGLLGASKWLPLLFPGFAPSTNALGINLVYIIFPTLPLLAASGILTALLNGFHKFWLASFAPAVASLSVIAAALLAPGDHAIYFVGIATAVGFFLQFAVLVPATASLGIRYRPVFDFRHPAVSRMLRLGVPLFLYLVVANVSAVLERNMASRISAGAVSTLTYAFRLFTVPSNFLAAPLAIVAYPWFAREATREQRGDLANQGSRLFYLIVFLFLPVTVWTVLNAGLITRLLYEHGRFLPSDSWITARVLSIYSVGILPNAVAVLLLRCFFAIEDTVTPLLAELFDLFFFVLTARYLTARFGLEGLVAARCMTFFVVMTILITVLLKKQLLKLNGEFLRVLTFTFIATAIMGTMNWIGLRLLEPVFARVHAPLRLVLLVSGLLVSTAVFLALARLFRLKQAQQIMNTVRDLLSAAGNRSME